MTASRFLRWLSALLLSSVVGLVGCTQPPSTSASAPEAGRAGDGAAPAAVPAEAEPSTARQIARTGALSLRCNDLPAAADQLRKLAESLGGYVSSESIDRQEQPERPSSAYLGPPTPASSCDTRVCGTPTQSCPI